MYCRSVTEEIWCNLDLCENDDVGRNSVVLGFSTTAFRSGVRKSLQRVVFGKWRRRIGLLIFRRCSVMAVTVSGCSWFL